ncbi:MAG: hypothetical protein HY331_14620 [Chloroflexi bacterium]|nr:hypothetical protein [Chloroflexota bacterium]
MNWLLGVPAFVVLAVPVGTLLLDRILDVPAPRSLAIAGPPAALVFVGALLIAAVVDPPLATLLVAGLVGGLLGTVTLDLVRLVGVRFGAFPADMPTLFGLIALGLAPRLQRNLIATTVERTARLGEADRLATMRPRVQAMAGLPAARRQVVVAGMMHGLGRLGEQERQQMLATQMALLTELSPTGRQAIMRTMDAVGAGAAPSNPSATANGLPYCQPRGMPQLPMATFRALVEQAIPQTLAETRTSLGRVLLVGYGWHALIGATFGVAYTLLFGRGNWPLAFGWGVFVWAAMMIAMPPMMPMIRFPRRFPIVPFIAHLAMAAPIGLAAQTVVTPEASAQSLLGWLGVLP